MYKNMLVPVDGSTLAEEAFAYTRELAGRLGANVTVLHVVDPSESRALPMHQAYARASAEVMEGRVADLRKRLGLIPGGEGPKVFAEVAVGHPPEQILRYAQEKNMDLLVMSTHGRTGVRRLVLGSVADEVLRHSPVPVLLVRAGTAALDQLGNWSDVTVVVPLDGSKLAESVLPHVQALGQQAGNERLKVVLVSVCEPPPMPPLAGPEIPFDWQKAMDENWATCRRYTREYLAGVENHLKQTGLQVRSEPIEQMKASVAEEIVQFAGQIPLSLIVMATHGRTGVGRWAFGSVAQKILTGASSPILMVRPAAAPATVSAQAKATAGRQA